MKFASQLLICFLLSYSGLAQSKTKRSIQILSVDFDIETPFRISCEIFKTSFSSHLLIDEITNQDSIRMLDNYLDTVQYSNESRFIDTRAEFVCKNKAGKAIRICMDRFSASINGRIVDRNHPLYALLKSMIPQK
jgi:hypothetical protein